MAKIFITGVSGFIGKALTDYLLLRGHEVTGLSRRVTDRQHENYSHIHGDLTDVGSIALEAGQEFDLLLNLAWRGSGGADRSNIPLQMENVSDTDSAVNLCHAIGAKRFIGVGTITEDEVDHVDFNPQIGPGYIYGLTKRTAYGISRFRSAQLEIEHIWVKLGNTFGLQDTTGRFLSSTLKKFVNNEPASFSAGTQNYDFIFLSDAVRAFEELMLKGQASKTYYLGSGEARPLRNFIEAMHRASNSSSVLTFGSADTAGVTLPLNSFSIADLLNDTDFRPEITFEEGINLLINEMNEEKVL